VDFNPPKGKPEKSVSSRMSSISIGESELLDAVNEVADDLLNGLTFVLSGVFQEMAREKLENFITEHGGRSTSAISGKTDFLVVGYKLEDGREVNSGNKYKTAITKKVPILTETEFESYIQKKSGNDDYQLSARRKGILDAIPEAAPIKEEEVKNGAAPPCEMWTERYKPKTVYDLIGNKAVIDQLYEWLKDWDEVCIRGNKKQVPFRKGQSW
jgi:replication factor C subunit 1